MQHTSIVHGGSGCAHRWLFPHKAIIAAALHTAQPNERLPTHNAQTTTACQGLLLQPQHPGAQLCLAWVRTFLRTLVTARCAARGTSALNLGPVKPSLSTPMPMDLGGAGQRAAVKCVSMCRTVSCMWDRQSRLRMCAACAYTADTPTPRHVSSTSATLTGKQRRPVPRGPARCAPARTWRTAAGCACWSAAQLLCRCGTCKHMTHMDAVTITVAASAIHWYNRSTSWHQSR